MTWRIFLTLLFSLLAAPAWATQTAFVAPTNCTHRPVAGGQSWKDPSYAETSNNVYASVRIGASHQGAPTKSYELWCTGFDFSALPSHAIIDAIDARFERKSNVADNTTDRLVRAVYLATPVGTASISTPTPWPTADGTKDYTILGHGLIADRIKASSFGVILQVEVSGASETTASVDSVSVRITYDTVPGGTATPTHTNTSIPATATRTNTATRTPTNTPTMTVAAGTPIGVTAYAMRIEGGMAQGKYIVGPTLAQQDCIQSVWCTFDADDASATWGLGSDDGTGAELTTGKAMTSAEIANIGCVKDRGEAGPLVFTVEAADVTTGDGTCWISVLKHATPLSTPTASPTPT